MVVRGFPMKTGRTRTYETPHDYDTISNTGSFFVSRSGSSKWISPGEIGVRSESAAKFIEVSLRHRTQRWALANTALIPDTFSEPPL